jgi:hypothetical protein
VKPEGDEYARQMLKDIDRLGVKQERRRGLGLQQRHGDGKGRTESLDVTDLKIPHCCSSEA